MSCENVKSKKTAGASTLQSLPPSSATFGFLLSLSVLQHDDQDAHKDGHKINKQVQGVLHMVCVMTFRSFNDHLQQGSLISHMLIQTTSLSVLHYAATSTTKVCRQLNMMQQTVSKYTSRTCHDTEACNAL